MRRLRLKNTKLTLQIIGWIEIIGGIMGLWMMGKLMMQTGNINGALLLIFLIGLGLFIFCIYSGKKLFADKRSGIIYSIINYVLQIFQWFLFGYGFSYSSGINLSVGLQGSSLKFAIGINSIFEMSIKTNDAYFLKTNLFAAFVLLVLFDILAEMKTAKSVIQIEQLDSSSISTSPTHL